MTRYPEFFQFSPNYSSASLHPCGGLLVHHSSLSFEKTIERMISPLSEVSYHTLIAANGTRCVLVRDEHIAWHAGASVFLGRSRCNDFLLGLAFAGNTYQRPLTDDQIASALEWLDPRWMRYRWNLEVVTDHRQVSPGRKDDLNPVEWDRFKTALENHFPSSPPPVG